MFRDITIEITPKNNKRTKIYPSTKKGRELFEKCYGIGNQSIIINKSILTSTLHHFFSQNLVVVIQGVN